MKKIKNKTFKKVLSKFSTGITIVAINHNNIKTGKTVNSFSSLSLSPPLVLFSLAKNASSINKFKKSKFLSINILSKKQTNISKNFSKTNSNWKNIDFIISNLNVPLIKNCLGNLECKMIKLLNAGDHTIFICKVINVSFNDKLKPLIYFNSKYI